VHEIPETSHGLYATAKDFAGPLATVLAASVALCVTFYFNRLQYQISSAQRDIALDKLKLDAFEKRYEIYTEVKALMQFALLQNDFQGFDHEKLDALRAKIDEARFFFGPMVLSFLDEIDKTVELIVEGLAGRYLMEEGRDDKSRWAETREQIEGSRRALRNFHDEMPRRFESSLSVCPKSS
jgi:hypothetical protein